MSPVLPGLARPGGVGDQHAAEADHVAGLLGERGVRRRRRFDPAEPDHREPARGGAEPLVQRQERARWIVHVRQVGIEARAERALAEGEIVEYPLGGRRPGDARCLVRVDPARELLVGGELDADDEAGAAGIANGDQHLAHEADAAFEAPAIAVAPVVAGGREELRDEIAMGAMQLDAAEAGALQALGALRIARDDLGDILLGEGPGGVPIERFRLRRGAARHRIEAPELLASDMAELAD